MTDKFFEYENEDVEQEENFKRKYGSIPKSIMLFRKSPELMRLIDNDELGVGTPDSLLFHKRGSGAFKDSPLRYSIYNPDQASFIIQYYTEERDLVLDPFMGRATRPMVTLFHNRRYIGFDTCSTTVKANAKLIKEKFPSKINDYTLVKGDGTKLKHESLTEASVDAIFSCPPYYNIEKYSGEEGDLSRMKPAEFDSQIEVLFEKVTKLIKPSVNRVHPIIFTVGSVRMGDKGLIDMDYLFQRIAFANGLVLHDKLLTENLSAMLGFTFRRNFRERYVGKNFETTLVFIKK